MPKTREPIPETAPKSAVAGKCLADLLVERNDVQRADMDKALQVQRSIGGKLEGILVRSGTISEDVLLLRLAELQGAVYLRNAEDLPDGAEVYRFISQSQIKQEWFYDNGALMWRQDGRLFCIARDILDHGLRATLAYFYPREPATLCLAANHHIERLLDFVKNERTADDLHPADSGKTLWEMAEEAPIIEFVNKLFAQAVDLKASDIHIEPTEEQFAVRMRVDGVLHTKLTQPVERFPAVASRIKLISGLDIAERRLPQDGRVSTRIAGQEMDIRVSTVPCAFGESVVLRMLAKERPDLTLANLGMEPDHLALFRSWLQTSNGIVLVTGPTGSGKSTTLASALTEIDDGVKKLITVEDPGRASDAEHNPDPDPCGNRIYLRSRLARHFAPGSRCHHDRRDSRSGDRGNCHSLGHDRSSGAVDGPYQRRPVQLHPVDRHGNGTVSGRGIRPRRPRRNAWCARHVRIVRRISTHPSRFGNGSGSCHRTCSDSGGSRSEAAMPAAGPATAAGPAYTS